MILLSLDFETTGLDKVQDRVIEVGAVLWNTDQHRILEAADFLVKSDVPITSEITKLTGITPAVVNRFGFESHEALSNILAIAQSADAFLGQNIARFDKPILDNWIQRERMLTGYADQKLVIDTLFDIPGVEGRKLQYMLADHMRLNPFPHSAITDALSCIILIEEHTAEDGNIDPIVERAKSPFVILQSHQPRGDEANKQARERKFRWNPDFKIWWRVVKEQDIEAIRKDAPFDISIRQDLSIDQLWKD
jgi:DNA polymerase III epsilon subunit-like protein